MMHTKPTAIIFDCFGVIYQDAFQQFIEINKHHLPKPESYYYELANQSDLGLLSNKDLYQELSVASGELPLVIEAAMNDNTTTLNRLTVDIIRQLKPNYRMGLISNISRSFLDKFVAPGELQELFEETIASTEVGHLKPDREIFAIMAERLGVPFEEWLFIDDRPKNVDGAAAHGIPSYLFTTAADLRAYLTKQGWL